MSQSPFKRRTVIILSVVIGLSLVAALFFAIFGDVIGETNTTGANAFSRSAIGHRGLVEVLRSRDVPVLVSQHDSANKAQNGTLLVVAEPIVLSDDDDDDDDNNDSDSDDNKNSRGKVLTGMIDEAPFTLVVLPKWYGIPDPLKRSWIGQVELLDIEEIRPVLQALYLKADIVRPEKPSQTWHTNLPNGMEIHGSPSLIAPQLMALFPDDYVWPLIYTEDGVLLAEILSEDPSLGKEATEELIDQGLLDDHLHDMANPPDRLWVLSDPDLLSNHGLRRGANADIAVAIIDFMRAGQHPVVVDETMHGFQREPSIWQALFEFPLAMVTIQALLAVFLLLWASMSRFGKPLPARPAIEPGKAFLINNTANLLRFGHHAGHALARYLQTAIQDVSSALHAPYDMAPAAHRKWLERIQENRKVTRTLEQLERRVDEVAGANRERERLAVSVAHHIFQWKQEMIHGSANRSHD